jgi:UDP-N-acetylglucosamine 3-dehydrogenase
MPLIGNITNTKKNPKIALVGCGAIAESYYLPALAEHPSTLSHLVVVDRNKTRAQELAMKYKLALYLEDYREILNRIDGAIVAVPTHLHYQITKDFLLSGVPVLCEKPLADTAANARELVHLARQKNVALAVNYLGRLIPSFAKAKEIIDKRTLGEPLYIKYYVGEFFEWPTVSGFYFNAPLSSRGILRDRGAHAVDHICWWLKAKPRLISSLNDACGGSEAVAEVKFESGKCKGELKLSWLASFPCTFEIICEEGVIEGNVYDYRNVFIKSKSGGKRKIHLPKRDVAKNAVACKIVKNFIDVVSNNTKPLISGNDVLDSMDFIDECYANAALFEMPWYGKLRSRCGS